eukprot:TRINITY_DN495_c0_g1_i3.p1 TRINITY_DN495_c0_g1~~TRINITY_DN495_c0_g1_i3.p1  ORF type:complete len:131 (+),score=34.67 TRINITY_DN495_c0_g1_i3:577-969(+)
MVDSCYSAVRDQYVSLADGLLCVYSVADASSFLEIRHLQTKLEVSVPDVPVLLVGNKIDDEENREISTFEGKEMGERFGWEFIEVSAKEKMNVIETFEKIVEMVRAKQGEGDNKVQGETVKKRKQRCMIL